MNLKKSIGLILLILIVIIAIPFVVKEDPKTINELHQQVIDGKENDNQYSYNGYSFVKQGSKDIGWMWYTQVLNQYQNIKYDVPLHYGPKELEEIEIIGEASRFSEMTFNQSNYLEEYDEFNINLTQHPYIAYFSFDPNSNDLDYVNLAHHELRTNLLQVFDIRLLPACLTEEDDACKSVAILTCENTQVPIIEFREAAVTSIEMNDNCITVNGYGPGIVKGIDRLLYAMYGIME